MHPIFEKYFDILLGIFENDIAIMSQPWMYYTVLPIIGYVIFFFIKWCVITAPMWLPFTIVAGAFRVKPIQKKKKKPLKNK